MTRIDCVVGVEDGPSSRFLRTLSRGLNSLHQLKITFTFITLVLLQYLRDQFLHGAPIENPTFRCVATGRLNDPSCIQSGQAFTGIQVRREHDTGEGERTADSRTHILDRAMHDRYSAFLSELWQEPLVIHREGVCDKVLRSELHLKFLFAPQIVQLIGESGYTVVERCPTVVAQKSVPRRGDHGQEI